MSSVTWKVIIQMAAVQVFPIAWTTGFHKQAWNTEEEIHGFGINASSSHVDFMIGSKDLCITGTTEDGKEIAIFKDGNWAFWALKKQIKVFKK